MALPRGLGRAYWSTWHQRRDTVSQSLEVDETWIGGWDAVGLYEGNNKVPEYQVMTIHLTTHRLILVPEPEAGPSTPPPASLQVHLRHVRQTEFYTGFMRSSAKITLSLGRPTGSPDSSNSTNGAGPGVASLGESSRGEATSWTCGVCGFVNPLDPSESEPSLQSKCGLCGVGYAVSKTMSRPTSQAATAPQTPKPSAETAPSPVSGDGASILNGDNKLVACPACTFLNHPSLRECEICSTSLPRRRPPKPSAPTATAAGTNGGEASTSVQTETVRLSFRKGGVQEAYRRLKNVLSDKAWERASTGRPSTPLASSGTNRAGAGIDGILQTMSLDAKAKDEHMKDAFKDLEVLMVRAGEMVKLAQNLNARLSSAGGAGVNEADATLIRSSLVQLGLPAPALTQDMVRDEQKYLNGLARELGGLLTGQQGSGLMVGPQGRGVIGLDEVWGLWMRARGVALLPPSTLVDILPFLPTSTAPPIHTLTLASSLQVLHTPSYAPPAILSRILARLAPPLYPISPEIHAGETEPVTEASISLLEIASYENLPVGLAGELMASIERTECPPGVREPVGLVRDDQAVGDGGIRWYRDIISGWEL